MQEDKFPMHHDYDNDGYGWSKTSLHFYPWENWNKFACDRFLSDYNIIPLPLYRNPYVRNPCRAQSLICVSYIFSNSSFIRIADCTQTNVCVRVRNCDQYIAIYGHIIYPWYPPHSLSLSCLWMTSIFSISTRGNIFPLLRYRQNIRLKTFSETHVTPHLITQEESISFRSVSFIRFDPQMYERVLMFSEFAIGERKQFSHTHTHNRKGAYRHHFKRILKCRVGRNNLSRCDNTIMLLALLCVAPLIVL